MLPELSETRKEPIFVCKPDSHPLLYEWIEDFERTGQVRTLEYTRWDGKQRLTERYGSSVFPVVPTISWGCHAHPNTR
jgi:hypothetical protein